MNRVKLSFFGAALALGFAMIQPVYQAQGTLYFASDFNNPGQNGWYNFEWAWPGNGRWSLSHLPTGGYNGSGAAQIRINPGFNDYNLGFIISPLNRTFNMGDSMFIRFRIRYNDNYGGFIDPEGRNKFILIGTTGTTPNSRIIVHMRPPNDSFGCTLGQVDYLNNTGPFPWATPGYFGLTGSWFAPPLQGQYGSLGPYVNINWIGNCAPPALVAAGNNSNAPAPGPNSARPVNGWYHFQIQATSGNPGSGAFRVWVNNNNYGAPTSQQIGLRDGLGVTGWGNSQLFVGGYQDGISTTTLGYRLDDFQLASVYDASWYPGSVGTPPTNAPAAPTNVRVVR